MTAPDPRLLDPSALRRRVLLTGLLTLALYVGAAYVITAANAPAWWLLPVLLLVVLLVVRPLMRPVFAAHRLRRAVAMEAFRQERGRG